MHYQDRSLLVLLIFTFQEIFLLRFASALKAAKYRDSEFEQRVTSNPHFVMFYAPWCGHCKRLQPLWDKFAERYGSRKQKLTVAKVDCTQDTPLCAREDIKSYPTLRLFHDGNKSTYRGNRNLEDFQHFVHKELTSDTKDQVDESVKESPKDDSVLGEFQSVVDWGDDSFEERILTGLHFVQFYAPWCPHCQKLKSIWEDLGKEHTISDKITIAKVDCTKHKRTCESQNVDAYPTLVVYNDGQKVEEYSGHRTFDKLVDYTKQLIETYKSHDSPSTNQEEKEDPTSDDSDQSEVAISLNKENFDLALRSGKVFVDFYAPWCVHCRNLAPTWEKLAIKVLLDAGGIATIAKVDCTVEEEICKKYQINSFPTLVLFWSPTIKEVYSGPRTLDSLYQFVQRNAHDEL